MLVVPVNRAPVPVPVGARQSVHVTVFNFHIQVSITSIVDVVEIEEPTISHVTMGVLQVQL